MTQTVYVVTSGKYSDYGIEAVFLDKEKAEQYVEIANVGEYDPYDESRIEEYESDQDFVGQTTWMFYMDRDGNTKRTPRVYGEMVKTFDKSSYYFSDYYEDYPLFCVVRFPHGKVRENDMRHALKIANEKRIQLIASGKWEAREID